MKYCHVALILLFILALIPSRIKAQASPVYYMSNYIRVVQPDVDDSSDLGRGGNDLVNYKNLKSKFDTLLNPFTGGLNNPMFFDIDFNGDSIQDLYVFDREANENQFLLFEGLGNNSTSYRYAPQYHYGFPDSVCKWVEMADYNGDGKPDLFTANPNPGFNTYVKAYKNISYFDVQNQKFVPRFKTVADPLNFYNDTGGKSIINISIATNPQFIDVDKDGYLDMLGFDINLNNFQFFRNRGKDGGTDSLSFYYTKQCWGYFEEIYPHLYQPWNCEWVTDTIPPAYGHAINYTGTWDPDTAYHPTGFHSSGAHYNNSVCAFDVDEDGDIDLLIADGLNDSLAYLENGNVDLGLNRTNGYHIDTMINISAHHDDDSFPIGYPVNIQTMPAAYYVDINHDKLNDLIVAAGEPTNVLADTAHITDRIHNVWYYRNDGSTASSPGGASNIFTITTKDFLQNTMLDWGVNSAPCFIDVDKDGRKDLIIAVKDGSSPKGNSHLILYLNKAGKTRGSKPYLLFQTDDYLGFSKLSVNISNPVPSAYLNTKDSSTDLIMGNDSGQVMYFKDRSTGKTPADFHLSTSSLKYLLNGKMKPIEVYANSAPTAADINSDGKMDLLIGSNVGAIGYYRCLGYGPAPDYVPYFELVTNTFGNLYTQSGIDYQTAPCVADLDKDGKPDLLVGDEYGSLWYYHDFDTTSTLVPTYKVQVHDYGTGKDSTKQFSTYTIPAVAYLDQDSFPDIMLGCLRGGLLFLGSAKNDLENLHNSGIKEPKIYNPMGLSLFPNPAGDKVTLAYNNLFKMQDTRLVVTDMLGRQVLTHNFVMQNGKGDEQLSTSGLTNGIYIVAVFSGDQLIFNNKLIIDKLMYSPILGQ